MKPPSYSCTGKNQGMASWQGVTSLYGEKFYPGVGGFMMFANVFVAVIAVSAGSYYVGSEEMNCSHPLPRSLLRMAWRLISYYIVTAAPFGFAVIVCNARCMNDTNNTAGTVLCFWKILSELAWYILGFRVVFVNSSSCKTAERPAWLIGCISMCLLLATFICTVFTLWAHVSTAPPRAHDPKKNDDEREGSNFLVSGGGSHLGGGGRQNEFMSFGSGQGFRWGGDK